MQRNQGSGGGATSAGLSTGGMWTAKERELHINTLELMAANFAIKTFTKLRKVSSIHIQIDNTTALSYLVIMGGTRSKTLTQISKEIWQYLLQEKNTLKGRMDPKQEKFSGRLGIQECKGSLGMDSKASSFSKNMQNDESDSKHLFAPRVSPPVEAIHEREAGPQIQ